MPESKIVLDLFVFAGNEILVVDRNENDSVVIDCLTTVWDYLPFGMNPKERILEIGAELGFDVKEVLVNAIGTVKFDQDENVYNPIVFRVETEKTGKLGSNVMNKSLKWMSFQEFLNSKKLYDEYKKLDISKVYDKEQYFFQAQNDYEGN